MKNKRKSIIFRTDTNKQLGTGHMMRCYSLASAWNNSDGQSILVTSDNSLKILSRFEKIGVKIVKIKAKIGSVKDAKETINISKQFNASWIISDGFYFKSNFQNMIKNAGFKLLTFDDMGKLSYYYADYILNQNYHAQRGLYIEKMTDDTKLLLGTKFVVLRQEFCKFIDKDKKVNQKVNNILITLGGSDTKNHILKVLKNLDFLLLPNLEIIVIVGVNYRYLKSLNKYLCKIQKLSKIRLLIGVENIADYMEWADIAISSGGITVWELAFMGVPSIILATTSIEKYLVKGLARRNIFITINNPDTIKKNLFTNYLLRLINDWELRENICKIAQQMIDGRGVSRVIKILNNNEE